MRTFSRTNQFKKDVKRAERRGNDLGKLKTALDLLMEGEPAGVGAPNLFRRHGFCTDEYFYCPVSC